MAATIKVKKNNYYSKSVTVRYSDLTPYNLTNKSVKFTVKNLNDNTSTDAAAFITKTITSFVNASTGSLLLTILETDTANLKVGTYKFDFRIEDLTLGQPANTITGHFIIEPIVTIE
jgi:hypothetical protein